MADVQLEKGYVRVANHLDEAITCADFSVTQMKLVRAVIRLTWGWGQGSVQITAGDLAKRCGLRDSGGFRRELAALLKEGVINEVARGHGRTPSSYAMNKNFEDWGEYSVPLERLRALFDQRPPSLDSPPQTRRTKSAEPDGSADVRSPHVRRTTDDDCPPPSGQTSNDRENSSASTETPICLTGGRQGIAKSLNGETLQRRKDMKDSSTTSSKTPLTGVRISVVPAAASALPPATSESDDERRSAEIKAYALKLSCALNDGIAARWGARPNLVGYVTGLDTAEESLKSGIPIELACLAIADWCRRTKKATPPSTISYLRNVIVEAFQEAEQRAFNDADTTATKDRGGAVRPIAQIVGPNREQEQHAQAKAYDEARRVAAVAWGKNPANAAAYREIVASVNATYAGLANNAWTERARITGIVTESAERAGFPSFDVWLQEQRAAPTALPNNTKPEDDPNPGVIVRAVK